MIGGMLLQRREWPVLFVNVAYLSVFTTIALGRANYEFVLYAGVVLVAAGWVLWKQSAVRFDSGVLWGLTLWGFLHMAGGNISVGDGVLYDVCLVPLVPAPYHILRFDHVVHVAGFGVMTLVCHHILGFYLKDRITRWWGLAILVVMMGSGVGALNEIIEFAAVLLVPETGVGGYYNTLLDLVCNLIGGIVAVCWIGWRRPHEVSG